MAARNNLPIRTKTASGNASRHSEGPRPFGSVGHATGKPALLERVSNRGTPN